jgi:hypothetical protein
MTPIRLSVLVLTLAVLRSQAATLSSNLSFAIPPAYHAVPVSPSLVSLSIEQDRWTDWSGTTSINQFFYNVMWNVQNLTGVPPVVRIGANSEDHTNFNKDVRYAQDIFPDPNPTTPYPEATNITVGNGYYSTAKYLLPGTQVIWGVNLGENNLTAALLEAKAIFEAFSSPEIVQQGITLKYIEIGNEPDLYLNNGLRPSNYTVNQYVTEWTEFANKIFQEVQMGQTQFLAGAFAESSHNLGSFSPQAIYNLGILDSTAGQKIQAFSEHHYQGSFCSGSAGLLADLMNKATIRGNLTQYTPDIQATNNQGLDYILGETNSYSCHGAPGVSNTAGAAIWALDYLLYAATLNIKRVHFHDGIGFKYNLIQPISLNRSILDGSPLASPLAAHVQPQYYAAIVAAEAIGQSGEAYISELTIDDDQVSGFVFYEGSRAKRMVLINHTPYFQSDAAAGTRRPVASVELSFPPECAARNVQLKMLEIEHSDDTSGVTWGGQTYETPDGLIGGDVAFQTLSSTSTSNEYVGVPASQAVLVTFLC